MGDDGKTLAEHWPLLVLLAGSFGGVFFFIRALMGALDSRQHENIKLYFSNGGRQVLVDAAKAGALEALAEHTLICPQSPRVQSIEERLITLERG